MRLTVTVVVSNQVESGRTGTDVRLERRVGAGGIDTACVGVIARRLYGNTAGGVNMGSSHGFSKATRRAGLTWGHRTASLKICDDQRYSCTSAKVESDDTVH